MTQNINDELERLLETDPIASHAKIMELTRPQPAIIHKDFDDRQLAIGSETNGNEPAPLLDDQIDQMIDAMAQALTQTRIETACPRS